MNPHRCFLPMFRVFVLLSSGLFAMLPQESSAQTLTLCYKNQTIQVPAYQLNNYLENGATVGSCGAPLPSSVVTNTNDAGAGSLRQAILNATNAGYITFAANVTNTITLTGGEIVIAKNIYMVGPGANVLSISGNNASRVFNILGGTNTI
jgi:hypothetical protein